MTEVDSMAKGAGSVEHLTDEEITQENIRLMAERTAIGDRQEALIREFSARKQRARAAALAEGMSVDEAKVVLAAVSARVSAAAATPADEGEE